MKTSTRGAWIAAACALLVVASAIWFVRADAAHEVAGPDALAPREVRGDDVAALVESARTGDASAPDAGPRTRAAGVATSAAPSAGPALLLARVTGIETGEPIAHVYVTAWRENGTILATPQEIETDESGLAELEVEHSVPLVVSAQGDGRNTSNARLDIAPLAPGERREVALSVLTREDLVVHGVVMRRDTREPIADVTVDTQPVRRSGPGPRAITANDGTFRIAVRSFATWSLRYEHAEYGTALSPARPGHEDASRRIEILLDPCATIRALVRAADGSDTTDWSAVASASPWSIEQPNGSWVAGPGEVRWTANVASDGIALVTRLPARAPIDLEIRRGSRAVWNSREPIVLAPGEVREIECRAGAAAIHGYVREIDGTPAPNVEMRVAPALAGSAAYVETRLRAGTALATTDAEGAYRFEGLEPGAWSVGPAPAQAGERDPLRDPAPIAQRVVLEAGGAGVRHDVVLVRGLVVAGRVEHADGRAARDAVVLASNDDDASTLDARCDADGAFVIGPLVRGPWKVHAYANGSSPSRPVVVQAGAEDVVLRLRAESRLAVVVRDEAGEPVGDAFVGIVPSGGLGEALMQQSDADGRAEFAGLQPDAYGIAASTHDGRYAAQPDVVLVQGVAREVALVLRPGGRASVRFDGPGNAAVVVVSDRGALVRTLSIVRGATADFVGPVGEVDVQLHVGGKTYARRVALAREPGVAIVFDGAWR